MANEPNTAPVRSRSLPGTQIWAMAAFCLAAGLAIGYLFSSWPGPSSSIQSETSRGAQTVAPEAVNGSGAMRLERMKRAADQQAGPLLEKLKGDPRNST